MKITGFQKTSLIDYPEKIACTLFLHGCNFRCSFCHNPELVLNEINNIYSENEIFEFLEKRKGQLDGVCITGGEPLLSLEFNFLEGVRQLGYSIKIDTNGSFPERLKELIEKNLVHYVAMDIKSSRERYGELTDSKVDLGKIEESIRLIDSFGNYEFRTTVLENFHDAEEMKKIAIWLNEILGKKPKKFFLQGFKNNGKLINSNFVRKDTSKEFLEKLKEEIKDYFEEVDIRV